MHDWKNIAPDRVRCLCGKELPYLQHHADCWCDLCQMKAREELIKLRSRLAALERVVEAARQVWSQSDGHLDEELSEVEIALRDALPALEPPHA